MLGHPFAHLEGLPGRPSSISRKTFQVLHIPQSVAHAWDWLSRLSLPGSVPSTGAGVHFHLLYCAVGLGLVGMLLEAIGEKVTEAEEAAVEEVAEAVVAPALASA